MPNQQTINTVPDGEFVGRIKFSAIMATIMGLISFALAWTLLRDAANLGLPIPSFPFFIAVEIVGSFTGMNYAFHALYKNDEVLLKHISPALFRWMSFSCSLLLTNITLLFLTILYAPFFL